MKIEYPAISEAKAMVQDFEYALLYKLSELKLCKASDLKDSDWNECVEARVFRQDAEIHLLFDEEQKAIFVQDTDEDERVEHKYKLEEKHEKFGAYLVVVQYLAADQDGQMCIELTRLAGMV